MVQLCRWSSGVCRALWLIPLAPSSHFSGYLQSWQRGIGGAGDRNSSPGLGERGQRRGQRPVQGREELPPPEGWLRVQLEGEPDAREPH